MISWLMSRWLTSQSSPSRLHKMMTISFKHNFNDNASLEVKRSEHVKGALLVSVTTREFYISKPELESLRDSINEMLSEESDGSQGELRESSLPSGNDEESVEALLSEEDTRSS